MLTPTPRILLKPLPQDQHKTGEHLNHADVAHLRRDPASPAGVPHEQLANAIRALAMDAVEQAKSGHPGMPMGMADIATVLFTQFLRFDPQAPDWPDRDRFVLSNGHGSMLLYGLLHLTGYPDMTLDELKRFRQLGSRTAGHPERGHAERHRDDDRAARPGPRQLGRHGARRAHAGAPSSATTLVDHHTYVFAGDGCLMEGISHEALSLAGHLRLNKLIVLWDDNSISIDGPTDLAVSDDQLERFRAHGWAAERGRRPRPDAIAAAIDARPDSDRPSLIACRTTIAFGAPTKAGTAAAHGSPLGADEIAGARERLGWDEPPFVIPEDIRAEVAQRRRARRGGAAGLGSAASKPPPSAAPSSRAVSAGELPAGSRRADRQAMRRVSAGRTPRSRPARPRARCSTA